MIQTTRQKGICIAAFIAIALGVLPLQQATAQENTAARRVYEEQLRVKLDEQVPQKAGVTVDAGGWFNFAFMNYDDAAARKERTLRLYELRGWASLNVEDIHQAYIRGLLQWKDWNSNTSPIVGRGDEFNEEVERVWYRFDLGQYLRKTTGQSPVDLQFKVGRDFATIGTSLTLAIPLDMLHLSATVEDWEVMAFVGRTIRNSDNIDRSARVAHRQDRVMFGVEVGYLGFSDHRPFAYFLGNWDHTDPTAPSATQSYGYDSRYVGLGSEGSLIDPALHYQFELVGEWGSTYSNGVASGKDQIEAMAFDAILEYTFHQCPTRPKITFEYLYASGDSDRRGSATSTVGGNRAGTKDHAFNAFGFRDTGIALGADMSNLQMWTLGASCFPLENHKWFRKMEVGAKAFFYSKARSAGATSDTTSTNDASWLGWEWDVYCNWRITSDLAWTARYGMFVPGSAYDGGDKSYRDFFYTGIVLSF